jgi:hypothetical protein
VGRPESESQSQRHAATSRRVFVRRVVGGLAIAVPAFRVLGSSTRASAGTTAKSVPQICDQGCPDPCAKVHIEYKGHYCSLTPFSSTCGPGKGGTCYGRYVAYSTTTGQECYSFEDDEGPCG